jgi:hypothetical protein
MSTSSKRPKAIIPSSQRTPVLNEAIKIIHEWEHDPDRLATELAVSLFNLCSGALNAAPPREPSWPAQPPNRAEQARKAFFPRAAT